MGLLTESTPPVKMPTKLVFEEDSHQTLKNSPKFKRAKTDSVRTFPMYCGGSSHETERASPGFSGMMDREIPNAYSVRFDGPSAHEILRTSPGLSGVKDIHEISKAATYVAAAILAKPLRAVAPSEANNEYIKLNGANDDRKVESTKRKLNLKNKKLPSAVASRKLDTDVLFLKTGDDLSDLKTSNQPLGFASELENTMIPKRAPSLFHEAPDSGEAHVSLSKAVPLSKGWSNSVTKPFQVKAETNEESDDNDCVIIVEESQNASRGDLVKDQLVSSSATQKSSILLVQEQLSRRREIKGVVDDEDVVVLCAEEWENVQSGFKRHKKIEKDNRATFSDWKSSKRSEIYWEEDFTSESMKETEAKDLRNMNIVPYDAAMNIVSRNNVQKALSLYDELFKSLLNQYKEKSRGGKISKQVHVEAAMLLKRAQKWVNVEPSFGHVPGVEIGDQFRFRAELALVGLHRELMAGINYVTIEGKYYAISVVDSGRYENKVKSPDILVYSGQGGNPKFKTKNLEDQKLEGGNLALKNSMDAKLPVRVIRRTLLAHDATSKKMYIYDGLYVVNRFWPERSESGKLVLMFELVRESGQPDCYQLTIDKPKMSMENHSKAVATYDASQGEEKIPIMVVNEVNNEKPEPFIYITKIIYPHWYELSVTGGCNCVSGCSDSINCPCSVKNNGELPFNEEGAIIKAKPIVHECGPNCKCPPSCQNRVSQHGPEFPLEVFRTKSTGWGVRSQVQIPSGSFICEYIGELIEDKEADRRSNDEYLFDLDDGDGFTIDAAQYGNVGRFLNHSCSPNLYAQNVLYDHDDKRLPHVMFFAAKNIPALKELTYDYNYMLDRVHDADGNIKKKECCCGSRKCTRRMY